MRSPVLPSSVLPSPGEVCLDTVHPLPCVVRRAGPRVRSPRTRNPGPGGAARRRPAGRPANLHPAQSPADGPHRRRVRGRLQGPAHRRWQTRPPRLLDQRHCLAHGPARRLSPDPHRRTGRPARRPRPFQRAPQDRALLRRPETAAPEKGKPLPGIGNYDVAYTDPGNAVINIKGELRSYYITFPEDGRTPG